MDLTPNVGFKDTDIDITFNIQVLNECINSSEFRTISNGRQRVDGIDQRERITTRLSKTMTRSSPFVALPSPRVVAKAKADEN